MGLEKRLDKVDAGEAVTAGAFAAAGAFIAGPLGAAAGGVLGSIVYDIAEGHKYHSNYKPL